jgi:hypothetical protein
MKSVTIPYRQENHSDFDAEWPVQRKVTGWWYITGFFSAPADPARLYSYQFTLAKPRIFGIYPWLLHLALTDVQAGKHTFTQRLTFSHPDVYEIRPLTDGQMNLVYFELLAGIYNPAGEQVGLCMVELLPGARNPQNKINPLNMFKRV